MHDSRCPPQQCQVVCICGGYGFPLGNASAARITSVGKALRRSGVGFSLLHCGPSPDAINSSRTGVYEGIPFEYTTSVRRPANRLARILVYARALVGLTIRLATLRNRRTTVVYLYVADGLLNLYAGCLCNVLGIPVVQEFCEWLQDEPSRSAFNRWLYRRPIFALASGALVISKAIEERVRKRHADLNLDRLVHRLPSIVDAERFAAAPAASDAPTEYLPNFVYCGTWLEDVFFVLRALRLVKLRGYDCTLRIIGGWNESGRAAILQDVQEKGLSADVLLTGVVDDRALETAYMEATALLAPLWDDDKSKTRLPNKIGEYLASGRPMVGCHIGDLTDFLADDVNAFLAKPGDDHDFAKKMIAVLQRPDRATLVGTAGQEACFAHLDYRVHSDTLATFFVDCISEHRYRRSIALQPITRFHKLLRNIACGLLAVGIIASGRTRRAKRRALSSDVITSIYFHNPHRRLFARCIQWLSTNGYTFISLNDVIDIIYRGGSMPRGAVWLSFDDGYKEWIDEVMPLIRQRNIPVTMFIPSGIVENGGSFPWLHHRSSLTHEADRVSAPRCRDAVTLSELKAIAAHPAVTIGGHTVNHTDTVNLSEEQIRFELSEAKRVLESWTGTTVVSFAYPMGLYGGLEQSLLEELGYKLAATTTDAFITRETDPYLLPRFSVADNISLPEAICNMVGVWRPVIRPLRTLLRRNYIVGPSGPPAKQAREGIAPVQG